MSGIRVIASVENGLLTPDWSQAEQDQWFLGDEPTPELETKEERDS